MSLADIVAGHSGSPDDVGDLLGPLADLTGRPVWHQFAACRGMGTELFFPSRGEATDDAKAIRAELEATQTLPENRPLVTMSGGARAFTEDMWLAGQGVDLAVPVNKELRQAADDLIEIVRTYLK